MISTESMLFGLVGGLVGLKLLLLGFAAMLVVSALKERKRQRMLASIRAPARRPRLDVRA